MKKESKKIEQKKVVQESFTISTDRSGMEMILRALKIQREIFRNHFEETNEWAKSWYDSFDKLIQIFESKLNKK